MSPWIFEASVILGVMAISFILLCLLNSVWRFHIITSSSPAAPASSNNLHPLETELVKRMASALKEPEPVSLLMLQVESAQELPSFSEEIRRYLRREDVSSPWDEQTVGAVLRSSTPQALLQRIAKKAERPFAAGYATVTSQTRSAAEIIDKALQTLREPAAALQEEPVEEANGTAVENTAAPHLDPVSGAIHPTKAMTSVQKFSAKHRKQNNPVTCFYLDVDMLSRYNNHYGHAAGDVLLKNLVHTLEGTVREEDLIGRMEDDAFVITMACDPEHGHHIARRLCYSIKQTPVKYQGKQLKITVCIGYAGIPRDHSTPRIVVDLAKQACHKAQESGYGRWASYKDEQQGAEVTETKDAF